MSHYQGKSGSSKLKKQLTMTKEHSMHIIFAPAKEMVEPQTTNSNIQTVDKLTAPAAELSCNTQQILSNLAACSASELGKILHLKSDKLQEQAYSYYANFTKNPSLPAIELYQGVAYRALDIASINKNALDYLNKQLVILSALYGPLKANAYIKPYRLDFTAKLQINGKSLRQFWGKNWDEQFSTNDLIFNLASQEFASLLTKARYEWLDFNFYEQKGGQLKQSSAQLKQARGLCLRACAENNVRSKAELKDLNFAGYTYNVELSQASELVYVR